nr:hypothetical protein [Tanacetum cinerariifolium]
KESVATLREIVEEAKFERPLDRSLASACLYTKHSQELLGYVIGTCPKDFNKQHKTHASTLLTRKKHVTFEDQCGTLNNNTHKHVEKLNIQKTNVYVLLSTGVNSGTDASRSQPRSNTKKNKILSAKNVNKKKVKAHPRTNKSSLKTTNHVDSSIGSKHGVELIKGSCGFNLYTISVEDMLKSSLIFLLSKASKNKSWLWHRCLNHLNFDTINDLARKDLVRGLPILKFEKDHLCLACQLGKSTKHTHKPKAENTNLKVLNTLHMDLCGPMQVQTINEKKYILVIVDDYSRFTWVKFLRSKNETPEFVIKLLNVGIFHQKSVSRTPQQNGIVESWNRTHVEAARNMLIFSKAPMFLWAKAIATVCYTKNQSLIHTCHNKTLYELVHNKKPDLTFLRVFGYLCYPTNDSEDLGKLQPTADIKIFVCYAPSRKGYRIYNKRPAPLLLTPGHIKPPRVERPVSPALTTPVPVNSSGTPSSTTIDPDAPCPNKELEILFKSMFDEYLEPPRVERLVSPATTV